MRQYTSTKKRGNNKSLEKAQNLLLKLENRTKAF